MSAHDAILQRLAELVPSGLPLACVTLVDAVGSTPQQAGSKMIVTAEGLLLGTVGGGRIEHKAIETAQVMLADGAAAKTAFVEWNLQRDVGMTCGGVARLYFETYNHRLWRIAIFGAGHVATETARLLARLPCVVQCFDPRPEWLAQMVDHPSVAKICTDDMPGQVAGLPDDAFVLCLTRGHRSDLPVLAEIFRQRRQFPYLGVIGSAAKRKVLHRELADTGATPEQLASFHCPVGLPLGGDLPAEIAVSIVAQLLQQRDRILATAPR
ncbi:MAG: xanthine dehydrogenase accessory protein XdhC [Planctomycetales bacterium]|nr:xanthine dehydrogenase accessory protein XdhC [Planctomycetales bacterium]